MSQYYYYLDEYDVVNNEYTQGDISAAQNIHPVLYIHSYIYTINYPTQNKIYFSVICPHNLNEQT